MVACGSWTGVDVRVVVVVVVVVVVEEDRDGEIVIEKWRMRKWKRSSVMRLVKYTEDYKSLLRNVRS